MSEVQKGKAKLARGGKAEAGHGVHFCHLDNTTTPYFFTNFPEDATTTDLWRFFLSFGQVMEVLIDDRLSYVILSIFSSYLHKVLAGKRRSIRTIVYDFGTFVMFSIFESVFLVFPKHSNFRGFLK